MSFRPTFYGIEIGRSGLTVSQYGLDVTGHNIANVDTAGFTRQRLINTAYDPYTSIMKFKPVENALIGQGAYVLVHDQIRSAFLDRQFRTEQTLFSTWAIRNQGLAYVEALYEGSNSSNIAVGLDALFKAFNLETNEAADSEQRVNIQNAGLNFAQNLNIIYERLVEQQSNQNTAVDAIVQRINTLSQNMVELNDSIFAFEMGGKYHANDLRDKRNLILDELSALVDITYEEYNDDPTDPLHTKLIVKMGGHTLVDHLERNELLCITQPNEITGEDDVYIPIWKDDGTPLIVTGGEMRGHLDLRDSMDIDLPGIPYFVEQLNNLCRAVAQEINELHYTGFTHPSAPGGSHDGIDFFYVDRSSGTADYSSVTAKDFRLSDEVKASEYNIASSSTFIEMNPDDPEEMVIGNQEIALAIHRLLDKVDVKLFESTPDEVAIGSLSNFVTSMLLGVGLTKQQSQTRSDNQQTQLLAVDNQRTSISGVSLDEEMTNLIKYTHAYNGSSRVITTMDDALDTLINRTGRVGL